MSNDTDELGRFRPNLRPVVLALVANLIFGGGLIGWPYLRGQERAERSAQAFARFSACLLDGEVAPRAGLVLPRGERARFATLALTDPAWPGRCRPALAAIAHEPVIMLFPEVKGAEQEVAAGVASLDRALASYERESGRVSEAPLRAFVRLQALLAGHVRAASADVDPMRDAITLGEREDLPTPSIVPIRVGEGAFEIALEDGALLATAMDARVIGHVRVDAEGGVEPRTARRRSLVSAILGGREPPWVVMTTPASQCGEEGGEEGCAQRATGLVALSADGQRLSARAWLRGHPAASPRDAVHVGAAGAFIAALGADSGVVVRRFALPPTGEGEPVELSPALELEVAPSVERVRFLDGDPPALAWASSERAGVVRVREGASSVAVDSPGGRVALTSCGDAEDGWIGLFSERGARLARADGSDRRSLALALVPPEPSALRLVCGDGALDALVLTEGALRTVACDARGCSAPRELATHVERFDAVRLRGALLVAWSTLGGPVRVARVEEGPLEPIIPAACWAPSSGLCGAPTLAADDERAVLVTRQDGDLRVIASEDGRSWRALRGLEQP